MTKKKANSQTNVEPKAKTVNPGTFNEPEPKKQHKTTASDLRLDELKDKLRKKYHLLRHEPLNYDDKDQLLDHICEILGMYRNELDVVLQDLVV